MNRTLSSSCLGRAGGEARSARAGSWRLARGNVPHANYSPTANIKLLRCRSGKPHICSSHSDRPWANSNPFSLPLPSSTYRPWSYTNSASPLFSPTREGLGSEHETSVPRQTSDHLISTDPTEMPPSLLRAQGMSPGIRISHSQLAFN